ncbi:hypothetical protein FKM82_017919 [Ascaphus truei]
MAGFRSKELGLGVVWVFCFFVFAQTSVLNGEFIGEPGLDCQENRMQYTIPESLLGDAAPKVTVLDNKGKVQAFYDDPTCGTTLTQKSDGSIVIATTYEGCYVSQRNNNHMMTVGVSSKDDYGAWKIPEPKELRCPIMPAMDAPSPSQCTTIQKADRLLCGGAPISQDLCQSQGCCYDSSDLIKPCYYGNKVTAQCTPDGMFSVAISKDLTAPPLILSSVKLTRGTGSGCTPTAESSVFLLFQFPLSSCGTTFQAVGDYVIYENEILSQRAVQTWKGSSITRDSSFKLTVRCSLASSAFIPVPVIVFTLTPPPGVSSYGPLNLEMRIAKDTLYNQYYTDVDYPVVKLLRDPVFVEVRILQRVDPQLVLMLHQCWATPASDPFQQMQWPLLLDGCPFAGDNYLTQPISADPATARLDFPSYYKRFIVSTFTFVDSASQQALDGEVYFHCSASVCVPSAGQRCDTACSPRRKRSANQVVYDPDMSLVSSCGPVDFQATLKQEEASLRGSRHAVSPMKMEWVGIAAAVGVTCVAVSVIGLWKYIQRQHALTFVMMS